VPQDSEVFENTVRYNLTFGTRVPENIIRQALAMSAFDEVLPKLPHGIDTDIRERGVNMSGGQKQRLALARGLIAAQHSSLLLLDEPTSSIDQITEGVIFDRIFRAFADKAIIATVHRLHLLPRFDHIILMENGAIVEQGDFTTLLARQGLFARLWLKHLGQVEVG
jgi:ABC-type multidrug transport system fused ATPase/permease subunit